MDNRLKLIISVAVLACMTAYVSTFNTSERETNPEQILGISLPVSASDFSVELNYNGLSLFGEYRGFIRFQIAANDVDDLFADSDFKLRTNSSRPLTYIDGMLSKGSNAAVTKQVRPEWWNPVCKQACTLTYRSPSGSGHFAGPNSAWYIVEDNSASEATIYVYVIEI